MAYQLLKEIHQWQATPSGDPAGAGFTICAAPIRCCFRPMFGLPNDTCQGQSNVSKKGGTNMNLFQLLRPVKKSRGDIKQISRPGSVFLILFCLFIILPSDSVFGKDSPPYEIGLREGIATPDEGPFRKDELIGTYVLPWSSRSSSAFQLSPKLDATAGVLRRDDEKGFIGSVGPGLALGWREWPIFLVAGARAALLGETEYEDKDFGGRLQFIEDIGLNIRLNRDLEAGYRLQHMSNAFIYDTNPGLNMHIFEFRYSF
jgi:hypothetical protein